MARKPHVLVVEDDQDVRELMAESLEAGCAVAVAEDGETALDVLTRDRQKFDALVVDLEMPGLSGTALLNELRHRRIHVPALIVSGMPDASRCAREAHAAFIAKPFDVERLEAKVDELILRIK